MQWKKQDFKLWKLYGSRERTKRTWGKSTYWKELLKELTLVREKGGKDGTGTLDQEPWTGDLLSPRLTTYHQKNFHKA